MRVELEEPLETALLLKAQLSESRHLLRTTGRVCSRAGSRAGLLAPGSAHLLLPLGRGRPLGTVMPSYHLCSMRGSILRR